jgi:hypothetical protein
LARLIPRTASLAALPGRQTIVVIAVILAVGKSGRSNSAAELDHFLRGGTSPLLRGGTSAPDHAFQRQSATGHLGNHRLYSSIP